MRKVFATGRTRSACTGCEWQSLCTTISASGYAGVAIPGA
jgi:hypothetical protein